MDRRNFIRTCIACGIVTAFGAGGAKMYFGKAKDLEERRKAFGEYLVPCLDVHLVEHCNLNCKYCSHFSCIAEEEFLDINKFKKDLLRLKKITDGRLEGFILLGGEPLLHPAVTKFAELIRNELPYAYIEILTNGVLLNSMPDDFWLSLSKNHVVLRHSLYPVGIDVDKYYKKADKFYVKTYFSHGEIKDKMIKKFYRSNIVFDGSLDYVKRANECPAKVYCAQIYDGNIFHCHFGATIRHFNKKFNQNIPVTKRDFINIYEAQNIEQIKEFFASAPPICGYCGDPTDWRDWECAEEHDITEWTYAFDDKNSV